MSTAGRRADGAPLRLAACARPGLLQHLQDALRQEDVLLQGTQDLDEFRAWLAGADAALLPIFHYDAATAEALRASPRLRWLQLLTVGTERFAAAPPPPNLLVTTAGDSMSAAIAEHAFALQLALARQLPCSGTGQPPDAGALRGAIRPLAGRHLAILGYGAIGREVAVRARAFGMQVTGLRRTPQADGIAHAVQGMEHLAEVLAAADVVVVAAPLTPATRGLLDEPMLARCRQGALVVNVSRGAIVDSAALARLLASGHLGGAGLDVTDPEPLPPGHPLRALPNAILTPHVAAAGAEAAVARFVAANVRRFITHTPLEAVYRTPD